MFEQHKFCNWICRRVCTIGHCSLCIPAIVSQVHCSWCTQQDSHRCRVAALVPPGVTIWNYSTATPSHGIFTRIQHENTVEWAIKWAGYQLYSKLPSWHANSWWYTIGTSSWVVLISDVWCPHCQVWRYCKATTKPQMPIAVIVILAV